MTNSIKIIAAAVLFSTAAIGGAMAAPSEQGTYYKGVDRHNNVESGNTMIWPNVDSRSTGSINGDDAKPFPTSDGAYYEGVRQPMQDPSAN